VHGLPLSQVQLLAEDKGIAPAISAAITCGMLLGLHAAHEAKSDKGTPLNIVHRDVTPHNVMLSDDGAARVVDFGIASAAARLHSTEQGQVKGKLSYMSPEQLRGESLDRRVDLFAAGIVLWELLAGQRLVTGTAEARLNTILHTDFPPPSLHRPGLPKALDAVVMRALEKDRNKRFSTAEEMNRALVAAIQPAHDFEVANWLGEVAGTELSDLAKKVEEAERQSLKPVAVVGAVVTGDATERMPSHPDSDLPEKRLDASASIKVVTQSLHGVPGRFAQLRAWRMRILAAAVVLLLIGGAFAFTRSREPRPVLGSAVSAGREAPHDAEKGESPVRTSGPTSERADEKPDVNVADLPLEEPNPEPAKHGVTGASAGTAKGKATGKVVDDPCTPPYILLEGGIKRYKPECF
jgi:serine/threonine-protein kinase